MSIIGQLFMTKDAKEVDLTNVKKRGDLLKVLHNEVVEGKKDFIKDVSNIMIKEDTIDEELIEYLPLIKKYDTKLDNFIEMYFKAIEMEIETTENLEFYMEEIKKGVTYTSFNTREMIHEMKKRNEILERIAVALEK